MGKAVSDEDYIDTLLTSLPTSYDNSVSSISASAHLSSQTLTAEIFEQLIVNKYEHRKVKDKRENIKDEALSANFGKKKGRTLNVSTAKRRGIINWSAIPRMEVTKVEDRRGEAKVKRMTPLLLRKR